LGPSLRLVTLAAQPVVWLMNTSANLFVRHVLRETPTDDAGSTFSVEQLRSVVHESGESGSLDGDETALITGAIEFQSRTARDAMTPLADVVSIGAEATVAETHAACVESGFSRLPVRGGDAGSGADAGAEFTGYVHVKDVLEGFDPGVALPAEAVRPFVTVSPEAPLREVLDDMRRASTHVAAVRGNGAKGAAGPIEGILSMADVLRDVVGAHR
ncbi:CBS domain-containing protein, partial [Dietzia sp.]|uniref:CBS domain-containing protein n=1 Tax=Dietzia sp. TaxID=1871616 RepID=UPI002FD9AFE4